MAIDTAQKRAALISFVSPLPYPIPIAGDGAVDAIDRGALAGIYYYSAAIAALAGDAATIATDAGTLASNVGFAESAQAQSTDAGSLQANASLGAHATSTSNADGNVITQASLTGSAVAGSNGAGTLSKYVYTTPASRVRVIDGQGRIGSEFKRDGDGYFVMLKNGELKDYGHDWSQVLGDDTIKTSVWEWDDRVSMSAAQIAGNITSAFFNGASDGQIYWVDNVIVTVSGRALKASFRIVGKLH